MKKGKLGKRKEFVKRDMKRDRENRQGSKSRTKSLRKGVPIATFFHTTCKC